MNDSWVGAASLYPTGSCLRKTTRAIEVGGLLAWVCIHASLCSAGVSRLLCLPPYCTSPADSCQDQMYHFEFFLSRVLRAPWTHVSHPEKRESICFFCLFDLLFSICFNIIKLCAHCPKIAANAGETMGSGHLAQFLHNNDDDNNVLLLNGMTLQYIWHAFYHSFTNLYLKATIKSEKCSLC